MFLFKKWDTFISYWKITFSSQLFLSSTVIVPYRNTMMMMLYVNGRTLYSFYLLFLKDRYLTAYYRWWKKIETWQFIGWPSKVLLLSILPTVLIKTNLIKMVKLLMVKHLYSLTFCHGSSSCRSFKRPVWIDEPN